MDRLYDYLGETASKRRVERFKSTVSEGGGDRMRDKLVRQAEILEQEIKTYENNLGFLNLSKGNKSSNLVEELHHKVDKLKADLKEIREKIKIVDANS
jgi:predicted  nucleic acid-binding Zn-ribbon protein